MPIHKFAVDTDSIQQEVFDDLWTDFRSDVEQRHTMMALHDPDANDIRLVRKLADEMINVSGAEVQVYARTENADFDQVWDEDADPTYWNSVPMKAFFKPQPLEAELKKWGADIANKTEIVFSHHQLFQEFGERMLRIGDVVRLPYNAATPDLSPKNYRIKNATPTGNFRYTWLYFTCVVETLTADIAVRPPDDTPIAIDEQVKTGGVYRESL